MMAKGDSVMDTFPINPVSNPAFGGLRHLALMFSGVGKAGAQALEESPYLRKTSLAIPEIPK